MVQLDGEKLQARHRFGENADVGTATDPEDLWSFGGLKTIPTSPFTVYISSDDAGDAVEVTITYIEKDTYFEKMVTAVSAGFTFVDTGVEAEFIQRAWISGGLEPSGNVLISSDNTDAVPDGIPDDITKVQAYIPAGANQTLQCIHMVPVPRHGEIDKGMVGGWQFEMLSVVASSWARCALRQMEFGGVWRVLDKGIVHQGSIPFRNLLPYEIPLKQKTILKIEIQEVSHNSTHIFGRLHLRNKT